VRTSSIAHDCAPYLSTDVHRTTYQCVGQKYSAPRNARAFRLSTWRRCVRLPSTSGIHWVSTATKNTRHLFTSPRWERALQDIRCQRLNCYQVYNLSKTCAESGRIWSTMDPSYDDKYILQSNPYTLVFMKVCSHLTTK
jgi:hypothetical protein